MEFDELVREAEESVKVTPGGSMSNESWMFRGICYALLALAVAIKEEKGSKTNETRHEVYDSF